MTSNKCRKKRKYFPVAVLSYSVNSECRSEMLTPKGKRSAMQSSQIWTAIGVRAKSSFFFSRFV